MNTKSIQPLFIGIILSISISFISCVTIGTALIAPSDEELKVVESELGIHEGWYHPKTREALIKLILTNEEEKTGYLRKVEDMVVGTDSIRFVQLKIAKQLENVPIKYIVSTEVLGAKKRKSKSKKLLIAAAVDLVSIGISMAAMAASDDGFFGDWGPK